MRRIIITAFGHRDKELKRIIPNIKKYCDYPIIIYTNNKSYKKYTDIKIVDTIFKGHKLENRRSSNYWRFKACLNYIGDEILYLDDDMFIADKEFKQGFDLAKIFGWCAPINPRHIIEIDDKIGRESHYHEKKLTKATAHNTSPLFFDLMNQDTINLIKKYCEIADTHFTRGPMLLWHTIKQTGHNPFTLSCVWCVCKEDIGVKPIILHLGHKKVRDYYENSIYT